MYSVLGNHKTMTHRYTVNVIHIYRGIIVFTQQLINILTAFYDSDVVFFYVNIKLRCLYIHVYIPLFVSGIY